MENHEVLSGTFIRMLIANQNKSMPTKRQEIRTALRISSKDIPLLIRSSQEHLSKLGLELVGIDRSSIVDPNAADKYFLRKLRSPGDAADLPTEEFRRLILVFTFVILEQMSVEISKLWFFFKKTNAFEDENEFNDFLKWSKGQGYLVVTRVEENPCITLGWRYYCDFQSFDPRGYFQEWNP